MNCAVGPCRTLIPHRLYYQNHGYHSDPNIFLHYVLREFGKNDQNLILNTKSIFQLLLKTKVT